MPDLAPIAALVGSDAWVEQFSLLLRAHGFDPVHHTDQSNYIHKLVDDHTALIVVDALADDWQFWVTAAKTQQATRRIPVLVVAQNEDFQQEALSIGADDYLSMAEFDIQRIKALARLPDSVRLEQLACQCRESLPPQGQLALQKFNAGEYYNQHDLFELLWMQETGPVRDLYRAILQVGIAYYHIVQGNHRGALKMLLRCIQWLAGLPDVCQGVDVQQLREDAARVREVLQTMNPEEIGSFDRTLLKPVRWSE